MSIMIINDTIIFSLNCDHSILVISNHNSFRVLFDKIASEFLYEKILIFQHWEWPAQETGIVPVV